MFIIEVTYIKPIEMIDQHLIAHREFLAEGYQKNYFIASGPQNPRTGGIIISQLQQRDQLEEILRQDPFHINKLAEYRIIEFNPVKYHQDFAVFISDAKTG